MKKNEIEVGDVFQIPINQNCCAYGQILLIDHLAFPLYIAVFKPAYEQTLLPNVDTICESEIALVGGTMDARIYHGNWMIIGNTDPVLDRIPKPYFKAFVKGKPIIEDFFGKFVRKATSQDLEFYDNWTSFSPMAYEIAIKSIHGEADWLPAFDQLMIEHSRTQSKLI